MTITLKSILISCTILSSIFANAQTNYYVATTGNNSNSGSLSTPWLTIQHGLDQLVGGDTLNIMAGTYTEKLQILVSGITLRNHLSGSAIIDANGITSQTAIIEISNVSDILVRSLELKNSIMLDAQGISVDDNCQNITIENCKIHNIHFSSNVNAAVNSNTNAQGIIVYGSNSSTAISDLKILNNELYDCRLGYSEGIAVNGNVDGFEVSGNTVYNLTNIGIDLIGHEGTCSNAANDQARNGIVKNNIVHHCVSPYATSGGLYIDGGKVITVENNISYHNGYGIEVGCENIGKTTDAIIIRNNIFYDNEVCAIALGGFDYPSGSGKVINSVIRNNTCYYNDYSSSGNGELYLTYSENSVIENNIFYTSSQDVLVSAELTQPSLSFNYNVFYCQSGTANLYAEWNGNSYSSYSSFTTGTGTNAASVFANPLFVSPAIIAPDFHLQSASPAINAGNPLYTAAVGEVDLDASNRTNGIVDCGADEFDVSTQLKENKTADNYFKMSPNPCNGFLKITGSDIHHIVIYDFMGKQVIICSTGNGLETSLDISGYTPGIYYVVAFNGASLKVGSKKLIIQ